MKKMIAISVMCVLVIGAAFAETTVGGKIHIGGQILNGTNVEGSFPGTGEMTPDWYNTTIAVNFGDAKAGGKMSVHNKSPSFYDYYVWWRPIPQVRLQVGVNADGDFGTAAITGWGFTGEAKNGLGAINEYSGPIFGLAHARRGFYEGSGETTNVALSLFLVEGLTVNLWVPLKGENAPLTFAKTELNVNYQIPDIGKVTLSFKGDTGYLEADPIKDGTRVIDKDYEEYQASSWWVAEQTGTPKVFLSFNLTAIENMSIDLGLAYKFPLKYDYDKYSKPDAVGDIWEYNYSYNENFPLEIGLGYRLTMGDFAFKLRTAFSIAGSIEKTDEKAQLENKTATGIGTGTATLPTYLDKEQTKISVNILPSYKIAGMTVFLYAGMGIQIVDDWETTKRLPEMSFSGFTNEVGGGFRGQESNAAVSWFVNPYVHIPAGDSLRFQVGFQLYSDGVKYPNGSNPEVRWAIPFGFYTYF